MNPDPQVCAFSLERLLESVVERGGTDLHIAVGAPPHIRMDGRVVPMEMPPLDAAQTHKLCCEAMTDAQRARLAASLEVDFAFGLQGLARFRAHVFHQRGTLAGAFRVIPRRLSSLEELGLPPAVKALCNRPRGLVLVTGVTGSGKTTTLAAMIDHLNRTQALHIMTIEDPVEYLHEHQRSLVNQREIHGDTASFTSALRSALRQDPDVVLVGEMRDLETIKAALTMAETGHLTFGTLHTNSAVQTITRIIDAFPSHQQPEIRAQLSLVLEGVICQSLVPRARGGGRVLALEVMIPTLAIRNLIREDKVHQIYGVMQAGQEKHGMQTFNQSLASWVESGHISGEMALAQSSHPDELKGMLLRCRPASLFPDHQSKSLRA